MKEEDVVEGAAKQTGFPQGTVSVLTDSMFQEIVAKLKQEDKVALKAFGVFSKRVIKGGSGRHPRTGELIKGSDRVKVIFRPDKTLSNHLSPAEVKLDQPVKNALDPHLAGKLAEKHAIPADDVTTMTDAIFWAIGQTLWRGHTANLFNFGTFSVAYMQDRSAVHFKPGEALDNLAA